MNKPPSPLRPDPGQEHLLLRVENLSKWYSKAGNSGAVQLFNNLNFRVEQGQMVAVVGASGTGKSSLLHLLGALDRPTAGEVWLDGIAVHQLAGGAGAQFRSRHVGFVWQMHYLLPEFTALENIAMPLISHGLARAEAMRQAGVLLERVGLPGRADHRSGELSGGEQQRVSLARALVTRPRLLLADEPTGDLDERTAEGVFRLLRELHAEAGLTTVLVTHNMTLARGCDRVLRLSNGRIEELLPSEL